MLSWHDAFYLYFRELSYNVVEAVENGSFKSMRRLKTLYVQRVEGTVLVKYLTVLLFRNLASNRIKRLRTGTLYGLVTLESLYVLLTFLLIFVD